MARLGEFELIDRYFAPLAAAGSFGMKDDAALVEVPPGKRLVVTQDAIAANVHFLSDDAARTIAQKALRVNLSDLTAKGAEPFQFSLALGLAADWDEDWLAGFAAGLAEDCKQYSIALNGGDTFRVEAGPVISITALGLVSETQYPARPNGLPGQDLYVTGRIGEGALGLLVRTGRMSFGAEADRHLVGRYLVPEPPVSFAASIGKHASAAIDISDGLAGDLGKLASASGLNFTIELADIPLAEAAMAGDGREQLLRTALTGGDDYQTAFLAPPDMRLALQEEAALAGIELHHLCVSEPGEGRVAVMDRGKPVIDPGPGSYTHF